MDIRHLFLILIIVEGAKIETTEHLEGKQILTLDQEYMYSSSYINIYTPSIKASISTITKHHDSYFLILSSSQRSSLLESSSNTTLSELDQVCSEGTVSLPSEIPVSPHKITATDRTVSHEVVFSSFYTVIFIKCDDEVYDASFTVQALNPYGYLPGELFPLLPFYALLTSLYLVILISWLVLLFFRSQYATRVQRIFIPFLLVSCLLASSSSVIHLLVYNTLGSHKLWLFVVAVFLKSLRDSAIRVLLLGASHGWEIIQPLEISPKGKILAIGSVYFLFDIFYEGSLGFIAWIDHWVFMLLSFPLILMNTLIFYMLMSSTLNILAGLKAQRQEYKLDLFKKFVWILGIAALVSFVWTIAEALIRWFMGDQVWLLNWTFIAVWDIIIIASVVSMLVVWKITDHSRYLAFSSELSQDDDELSEEENERGLEMAR